MTDIDSTHNHENPINAQNPRKSIKQLMGNIYEKQYKKLLIIPLMLLILAIAQIGYQIASSSFYLNDQFQFGDFVNKGVSLKGGTTITLNSQEVDIQNVNIVQLEKSLIKKFPGKDIDVREQSQLGTRNGILIDIAIEKNDEIEIFKQLLLDLIPEVTSDDIERNIASIGSSLGANFFGQTFKALIFAFILMSGIVFFYFRSPIPSIAVILAALSDIIVTLAIFNVIGFRLSTAGIAAFLMLIGYSVDTDILLSTRVLRSKQGTVLDRVYSAMKTGLMMNLTTLIAILVALIFIQSSELKQLMAILLIGLLVDIINTWIQNAGILRWYMEKNEKKA